MGVQKYVLSCRLDYRVAVADLKKTAAPTTQIILLVGAGLGGRAPAPDAGATDGLSHYPRAIAGSYDRYVIPVCFAGESQFQPLADGPDMVRSDRALPSFRKGRRERVRGL